MDQMPIFPFRPFFFSLSTVKCILNDVWTKVAEEEAAFNALLLFVNLITMYRTNGGTSMLDRLSSCDSIRVRMDVKRGDERAAVTEKPPTPSLCCIRAPMQSELD